MFMIGLSGTIDLLAMANSVIGIWYMSLVYVEERGWSRVEKGIGLLG